METKNIITKLKDYLENDNFKEIDELLHDIYCQELNLEQLKEIDDILQEVTLYIEFKEKEYKNEALKMI